MDSDLRRNENVFFMDSDLRWNDSYGRCHSDAGRNPNSTRLSFRRRSESQNIEL